MKFNPHGYQQHALQQILDNEAYGLFLDMGLGKTVITLTAIEELIWRRFEINKVLVIAPLRVAEDTWVKEAGKWDHTQKLRVSRVLGTAKQRKEALAVEADVYVINRENVVWLVEYLDGSWPFDMIVIDELSSFKSSKSKRFRALRKVRPLSNRVVGLTGTPASNGYMDLWSEAYLLDRGARLGKTLTHYRDVYFKPGKRNGNIVYEWVLRHGAKDEIDNRLSDLCISMKAVDWIEMPERVDVVHTVTMDKEARKCYDQFARDHVLPLVTEDITAPNAAALTNKLLQMANGFVYDSDGGAHQLHDLKLDALEEIIEAAQGQPVLVFYNYRDDLFRIQKRFDAVKLEGEREIERWNKGMIPLMVAHPASAGHGLNLQEGGSTIVWFGMPWSLELYQQANARLHRQGQKNTVFVHHIITADTMDEDVVKAIERKDSTQESLLAALKARLGGWK